MTKEFQQMLNSYLPKLEIIESEYLPEGVVLFADSKNFYWLNTVSGECTRIPKTELSIDLIKE